MSLGPCTCFVFCLNKTRHLSLINDVVTGIKSSARVYDGLIYHAAADYKEDLQKFSVWADKREIT